MSIKLNALLLKEGDVWVAQCLEHDIVGQGESPIKSLEDLSRTIAAEKIAQKQIGASLSDIPPAPDWYWNKFTEKGSPLRYRPRPVKRPVKVQSELSDDWMDLDFMEPEWRECRVA